MHVTSQSRTTGNSILPPPPPLSIKRNSRFDRIVLGIDPCRPITLLSLMELLRYKRMGLAKTKPPPPLLHRQPSILFREFNFPRFLEANNQDRRRKYLARVVITIDLIFFVRVTIKSNENEISSVFKIIHFPLYLVEIVFELLRIILYVEFEIIIWKNIFDEFDRSAILEYGRIAIEIHDMISNPIGPLYEEEFNPRREENKNSGRSWWASIPRKISRVSKSNWRGALGGRVFSPRKTCSSVPPPSVWKDVWSTFYFIIQPPLPSFCTMLRIFSKSTRV